MPNVIARVRAAVQSRLADPVLGFNAKYAPLVGSAAYTQRDGTPIPPVAFDFTAGSSNTVWGRVAPDLVISSSPFTYPLLTIDADRATQFPQGRRIAFHTFSGSVQVLVEIHLSWEQSEVTDFSTWPDAVIDAMYASVNNPANPIIASGMTQAGDMQAILSPITSDAENWRRTISFPMTFQMIA